ncbi:ejaculatory bulb-specific protein 3-like [Schistocerca nitens]|uniref:ejaculatory bulb-specific protein 3-like n=1 Tax=Schistocerca nitens TaxID=7011 RepID=UPI0021181B9B|nr:ejaculatory bulb-specific protein 3-like [Schistocerca nitens]
MESCVFPVVLLVALTFVCAYNNKYDNFDVEQVLNNDRLLRRYHECLVSNSDVSCTAEGKQLKRTLPEALKTDCRQCSETQKTQAEKVIKFLIHKKPDLWKSLESKYDPSGTYRRRHDAELKRLSA